MPLQKPAPAASRDRSACAARGAAPRRACRRCESTRGARAVRPDRLDRAHHGVARRHVVRRRIHGEARDLLPHAPRQRVEQLQRLHLVVEQFDAHGQLRVFGREDVDRVAAHAERAALEILLVARVLHRDQPRDHVALAELVAGAQRQDHLVVFGRIADTVDRRHRRDDHDVATLHQALRRRQPHLLDVLVDRRVLLDEQVALRHVRFWLVIVVVRDEVLDRVAREELAKFRVELRGERLVRREHDRRAAEPRDRVRHREGLARLVTPSSVWNEAVLDPFDERLDRGRLVACGRIRLIQLEWRPFEGHEFRFVERVAGFGFMFGHGMRPERGQRKHSSASRPRELLPAPDARRPPEIAIPCRISPPKRRPRLREFATMSGCCAFRRRACPRAVHPPRPPRPLKA